MSKLAGGRVLVRQERANGIGYEHREGADITNGAFNSVSLVVNLRSGLRAGVCGVSLGGTVVWGASCVGNEGKLSDLHLACWFVSQGTAVRYLEGWLRSVWDG